jgi:hypothetical protein
MKFRHTAVSVLGALALAVPATGAASAAPAAGSPTGTVTAFAKSITTANGKASCALMTKGYQKKTVNAAVDAGAKPGSSCASVMTTLGKAVKANGGIPAYTLKIEKRTKKSVVVRMTYKKQKISGTYTTTLVGGKWLISASTVSA